jgi:thioredoxin-related protein
VILGVNIASDIEPAALAFVERYKLTYLVGQDVTGEITARYGVKGTPTLFYVDRAGRLVEQYAGAMDEAAFRQRIEAFVK